MSRSVTSRNGESRGKGRFHGRLVGNIEVDGARMHCAAREKLLNERFKSLPTSGTDRHGRTATSTEPREMLPQSAGRACDQDVTTL